MENFKLDKSSPNQFQMVLPLPEDVISMTDIKFNELTLNIFGTVVPGMEFTDNEEHWQGHLHHRIVGNLNYNSFDVSFIIDEQWLNWKCIYNWLNFINNNDDIHGRAKGGFVVDGTIIIFDNFNIPVLKVDLKNMFPISLSDIQLNNRDGDSFLETTMNIVYDYYKIL